MIRTAQKAPKKLKLGNVTASNIEGGVVTRTYKVGTKPGPKPSGNAKVLLTLRLDPDVVAKFRATGAGWQTRMGDVLRANSPRGPLVRYAGCDE